ncbi:L,D-transpeptidase family protein [Natronospora cellulosivora (SeqCode)]
MKKIILEGLIILILLTSSISIKINADTDSFYRGDIWNLLNYYRIHMALIKYQQIEKQGGWPLLEEDSFLRKGDSGKNVRTLSKRLYITGDLQKKLCDLDEEVIFDKEIEKALLTFQHRHGLLEDGVMGPQTLAALNMPVEEKIAKLSLNRKLIYNLFDDYITRYILVNIPAFQLMLIEDGEEIMRMRAIVGSTDRKTPVFNDEIEYIVINPSWRIPRITAVNDIIPKLKNDLNYLKEKNINVFDDWTENANRLDPTELDWSRYNINNFDLMLEQEAGPDNEMGKVKFMFPNEYLVYIHDTPHKDLFEHYQRAYSSGCVRVEKPLDLLAYTLKDHEEWTQEEISRVLETGETVEIDLIEAIPIFIVYWTAWVDENGLIHFRKDLYNHN